MCRVNCNIVIVESEEKRDKTNKSVIETLDGVEKIYSNLFSKLFKIITTDNGSNF